MTSGQRAAALCLAVGLAACGHAHTEGGPDHTSPPYDKSAPAAHQPGHVSTPPLKSNTGVPLATSAAGLLKPGAARSIQARLVSAGALPKDRVTGELDGPTRSALAHFQKDHDLPPTGAPDRATVEELGLNASDVFISGQSGK